MRDPRVLLDLRGLVLHAYYAGKSIDTVPDGEGKRVTSAAGAVEKFISMYLNPLLLQHQPINIIGVLEGAFANTRRRKLYPEYKKRDEQDAANPVVVEQKKLAFEAVQKLLLGIGAILVKTPYCEADDTIAYLCQRMLGPKLIYTVDNDLLALHCADNIFLVSGEIKTEYKGIDLEGGAPPSLVTLYKSIVGDSSDGYVGVKGFGEKSWPKLIETYGIEGLMELEACVRTANYQPILDSLSESPDPLLQKLYDQREQWRLCYYLAMLHPEWCEESFADKLVRPQWAKRVPTADRVLKVLQPLGLESHMPFFKKFCILSWLIDQPKWEQTKKDQLYAAMNASMVNAMDWESFDNLKHQPYQEAKKGGYVDVLSQRLTGGSFCFGPNLQYCFYVSVRHRDTKNCSPDVLKEILVNTRKTQKVAHNAKFEMTVAKTNFDFEFDDNLLPHDTGILASYVDENGDQGLKQLSKSWLNYEQTNYSDVVPEKGDMRDVSGTEVLQYGCDDSIVCAHMWVLWRTIMEVEQTWRFYEANEPFFDQALLEPFLKGIPIDYARLAELEREDDELFDKTDAELRALLVEHCSSFNKEGFDIIWPEIEQYKRVEMQSKGKSDEDIALKIEELRERTQEACQYVPFGPPKVALTKQAVSDAARSVGLPAIRSLKPVKITDYTFAIHEQMRTMQEDDDEAAFTEEQGVFLTLLEQAAPQLELASKHPQAIDQPEFVDAKVLKQYIEGIFALDKNLWVGDELNIGSSLQMAHMFYGKMGLPIKIRNFSKDDTDLRSQFDLEGAPSTNEIAIRTWMVELDKEDWRYKVLDKVLTIRAIRTRRQLYYKPYPLWKSPIDGKIHPGIRNCGTITRRPSGSSPNVFQVSKVKDEGRMRGTFLPQGPDELVVSIDFVQQELVILAALSKDPALLACYVGNNKRDVHTTTAAAIINMTGEAGRKVTYDEVAKALKDENDPLHKLAVKTRKKYAKTTNFLVVYGGSAAGLSRKIIVPHDLGEAFINAFYESYPLVLKFQEKTIAYAKRHGFVVGPFGTRKHCDGINDKNKAVASAWERQAINFPIQGGAAEILKVVMREIVLQKIAKRFGATIYAPVYDEIVASVPIKHVYDYLEAMANIMEIEIPGTSVRLATSVSIGRNWGEQDELGERPSRETVEEAIQHIINNTKQEIAA